MAAISRLGPGGYPKEPYSSFAGKVPAILNKITETQTFLLKPIDYALPAENVKQKVGQAQPLSGIPNWAKGIFGE
jgi:hypothetical protein